MGLLFCNAVKGSLPDIGNPCAHACSERCSISDEKPPVIKFLVTPVREVPFPVVDQEGREEFGAQDAEHANDQGERQTEGKYPDHDFRKTPTVSKLTTSQFDDHHRVVPFKDWLRKKFIEFNETCLVCFQKAKVGQ